MADGIRGLTVALDRVTDAIRDEVEAELDAEAKATETDMKVRINRVSGVGQESITVEKSGDLRRKIGPHDEDAYYLVFLEFGRKNADEFPFATPAAEGVRRRLPKSVAAAVKRATRRGA